MKMTIGATTTLSQIETGDFSHIDMFYSSSLYFPCESRDIESISAAIVEAEKLMSPGKTVYNFLREMVDYVNNTASGYEEPLTTNDIVDIISDGDHLSLDEMLVHTFELHQLVRFSMGKFVHKD